MILCRGGGYMVGVWEVTAVQLEREGLGGNVNSFRGAGVVDGGGDPWRGGGGGWGRYSLTFRA